MVEATQDVNLLENVLPACSLTRLCLVDAGHGPAQDPHRGSRLQAARMHASWLACRNTGSVACEHGRSVQHHSCVLASKDGACVAAGGQKLLPARTWCFRCLLAPHPLAAGS
jgi:hypothetical protein